MKRPTRRVWRSSRGWVALASIVALAAPRHCVAIGCAEGNFAEDLHSLVHVMFRNWTGVACTTSDQNLDGRVSAADLTQVVLRSVDPQKGPTVTFVGLATADGRLLQPVAYAEGLPVYQRAVGSGFLLVVEGRAGLSGRPVGNATFRPDSNVADGRPDLQVLFSRPLGDGSADVCLGGVPAVVPPDYRPQRLVTDALNDIGCNFSLSSQSTCVVNSFGQPTFAVAGSQIQFCATLARTLAFPAGDTTVTVRLRDTAGFVGMARQIIVRVGETVATPTPSPSQITVSATPSYTATASATHLASRTATPTRFPTRTVSVVQTPTPTSTQISPFPGSVTPTRTPSRSPTLTPTASAVPSQTPSVTRTPSFSPTPASGSPTPTRTRTPTRSPSPTLAMLTPTATRTRTPTRTATPTLGASAGPVVTFLGVTRADDTLVEPSGTAPDGTPIFERPAGAGFNLVVEGRPGTANVPVGTVTFRENGPPDLQILVSKPLGDGSARVCDRLPPAAGGVPAIDPPVFSDLPEVIDALNDLGCRFLDGAGQPRGRGKNDACVLKPDGGFDFVNSSSTVQFCGFIDVAARFPPGEVRVTVRLRDERGQTGPTAQIILRIQS